MTISKNFSVVTVPVKDNFYQGSDEPVHVSSTSPHRSRSHPQRSENVAKNALFIQLDRESFSQTIFSFFESMIQTVDAIDRALSKALSHFPQSLDLPEIRESQTIECSSQKFSARKKYKSYGTDRADELLSDAIEKADSVLKKFDALLTLSIKALAGFSGSAHEGAVDATDADEAAELPRSVAITLPKIAQQSGHICKPTALANLDAYYAYQYGIPAMPLRKNHKQRYSPETSFVATAARPISICELSKQHGSIQGEMLEAEKYQQLAKNMGYAVEIMTPEDPAAFKQMVLNHLAKGQPLVTCFAVDRESGRPESNYSDNEHACVITGCDPVANTIDIAHWGQTFRAIRIEDMFDSMNSLPSEREQEIYYRCEDFSGAPHLEAANLKYDKEDRRLKGGEAGKKESIIPAPASGFKNKVFSIVPNSNLPRWNRCPLADPSLA